MHLRSYLPGLAVVLATSLAALPALADPVGPLASNDGAPVAAELPPPPPPAPPKMRSQGMVIGGAITLGVGTALLVGGGVAYASDTSPNPCTPSAWFCGLGRGIGEALMIPGAIAAAVGLPLLIVGASPRTTSTAAVPSWTPSVSVGAGAASVRWTF